MTSPPRRSDAELARLIVQGSEDAPAHEAELCRRFLNRARLYGLKHFRFDVTSAEDLAQQVMVIVLEALRESRVDHLDRIDRFMLGTCRNVAHSMRRAEGRLSETRQRLSMELAGAVMPPWQRFDSRRVDDCLNALPDRDARLLQLVFQEGASAAEAAATLQTTPANARVLRHRAIARLRDCVEHGVKGEAS